MGEDAAQAERFQHASSATQEKPSSPSPVPSSTPSPSLNLGCTDEALRDNSQVNAVTVHTLLDKLVTMLDSVQENQHRMERRQISLEGSVKGIQGDLAQLSKHQASTSSTVGKLLEKSRKVSAHTRAVRERMERQSAQVRRLESNHAQLLRRNHFKVLIFQEEHEIPASVFVKEPVLAAVDSERPSLEETLRSVDLSSEDEPAGEEEAPEDSGEEKAGESRAEKLKRSSLRKVDSLKKAFSRQNIEKKMTQLGTKIVSVERREKIKKSLTSNHQKTPSGGKGSPFKVSPLAFRRKEVRGGESPAENEARSEDTGSQGPEEGSLAEAADSSADLTVAEEDGEGPDPRPEAPQPAELQPGRSA